MPQFEFWIVLSFLINAFPIVFMIFWGFHDEIKGYWKLLNVGGSQHELFPAFFFSFGMIIIGLFVDGIRHSIEWLIERCFRSKQSGQCAFYPRLFIEDIGRLAYPEHTGRGTRADYKGYVFAEMLLRQKLERYNIRYFMAEGFLSFAIGCLISGLLFYLLLYKGLGDKQKITFAFWFITITTPIAIVISFLWCRDKVLFINSLLHFKRHELWCWERRVNFIFFTIWYVTNILLHNSLKTFETPMAAMGGGFCLCLAWSF